MQQGDRENLRAYSELSDRPEAPPAATSRNGSKSNKGKITVQASSSNTEHLVTMPNRSRVAAERLTSDEPASNAGESRRSSEAGSRLGGKDRSYRKSLSLYARSCPCFHNPASTYACASVNQSLEHTYAFITTYSELLYENSSC